MGCRHAEPRYSSVRDSASRDASGRNAPALRSSKSDGGRCVMRPRSSSLMAVVTPTFLGFADGLECLPLLAVVGIVIVGVAWITSVHRRRRVERFSRLAPRWEGRVDEGGFFMEPRLLVQVDGVRGEL